MTQPNSKNQGTDHTNLDCLSASSRRAAFLSATSFIFCARSARRPSTWSRCAGCSSAVRDISTDAAPAMLFAFVSRHSEL